MKLVLQPGKAKQKNVPKQSVHVPATKPAERIFLLDISTVKKPNDGTIINSKKRILVDECTQIKFSDFSETKSRMIEPSNLHAIESVLETKWITS